MEKEFEELKELFQHKKASVTLSAATVEKKSKRELWMLKKNHLRNIMVFIITTIAIVFIDDINSRKFETSDLGFWILIGCSIYYVLSKAYLLYKLNQIIPDKTVLDTIQKLEDYKKLNIWLHTYGEIIYSLVLSVGVYLYLRPVLDKFLLDKTGYTILCFWWIWAACILWMLIHIFYIKRRRMKKDIQVLENYRMSLKPDVD